MTPEQYCQDKAAKSGSSFYYSFRFLPTDKPYDIHFVQLFQFRDGKVVLVREVCGDASMRPAAAGS